MNATEKVALLEAVCCGNGVRHQKDGDPHGWLKPDPP
jgi:hypothetical protein